MKRKWLGIALAMSLLLSMTACNAQSGETDAATDAAETGTAQETEGTTEAGGSQVAQLPDYVASDYVTLDTYTGVEVEVQDGTVTDEEFDTAINMLLEEHATTEQITDRVTEEGDTINFDYSGSIDGEIFEGGTATGQRATLGNGGWIDGFEEGLIGKPCGEEFTIEAYFPDDYSNAELSGKTAQFAIYINYIEGEEIVPELTDDFVKGLEDYTCGTVEEFETVYMEELTQQKTAYMENQAMNTLWNTIVSSAAFSGYPEGYVEAYTEDILANVTAQAAAYGYELEDFVEVLFGSTMEDFNVMVTEQAENQVKSEMVRNYIAECEGITVSEEEYLAVVQQYMDAYGYTDMTSFVNAYGVDVVEQQCNSDALFNKVVQFCYDNAVKVPVTTEAATEAETEAATEAEG